MGHRDLLLHTTILCGLALSPVVAHANPTDGSVVGGGASISGSGNTLTINQTSDRAIINWNSFDISSGETTNFIQPSSSSIALNHISENKPSQIDGTLTANGNIILVNPNGVVFGAGAQVNVNGLVAMTSDVDNSAFMAGGPITFNKPGSGSGSIINQGMITVPQVGLVTPQVINSGIITAKVGQVTLASGDTFTLDFARDGLTKITISGALQQQLAQNSGTIAADGGTIEMTAAAARNAVDALVVNSGTMEADTFQQKNGTIILSAADGTVTNSGNIYARGLNSGGSGGSVTVTAQHVMQQGNINVSGRQNGGSVNINFTQDYSDTSSSSILANGVNGNGGSIALTGYNGSTLTASGTYEATSQYGKGGTINLFADAINLSGVTLNVNGATGGDITVQGDAVSMAGTASARGTAQGGTINVTFDSSYADTADAILTVANAQGQGGDRERERALTAPH